MAAEAEAAPVVVEDAPASDDEMPALEEAGVDGDETGAGAEKAPAKQNRQEKKARKAIAKLDMKAVPSINRVTVKKSQGILFVISDPDVFQSTKSDTYVIFGEAKIENSAEQQQEQAAQAFGGGGMPDMAALAKAAGLDPSALANLDPAALAKMNPEELMKQAAAAGVTGGAGGGDAGEAVDESGLAPDEIDTIVQQAGCSRAKAVRALRKTGNVVDSILELTP